ncbi:hypothetical protein TNCV_1355291 [Trichonephila clavipes]|uniref:Uncharacterized protein n=1 Tax=Trichonephila clavipes TaxID=2585209 RepID=A0A8X6SBC5_TRICX|nr:hypothetical protein TNCV_1355291 [Trichonephila clavipes]
MHATQYVLRKRLDVWFAKNERHSMLRDERESNLGASVPLDGRHWPMMNGRLPQLHQMLRFFQRVKFQIGKGGCGGRLQPSFASLSAISLP